MCRHGLRLLKRWSHKEITPELVEIAASNYKTDEVEGLVKVLLEYDQNVKISMRAVENATLSSRYIFSFFTMLLSHEPYNK